MRNVILLLLCGSVVTPAIARAEADRVARNSAYFELGGAGVVYTVNYERFVQDDFSVRVGAGYVGISARGVGSASLLSIPVTVSYFAVGSGAHALELGGGVVLVRLTAESDSQAADAFVEGTAVAGTAIVGYRYAPRSGGFTFRASFTPLWGEGGFVPWGGVAFGFLF